MRIDRIETVEVLYFEDLSAEEALDFDWDGAEESYFFRYRGDLYTIDEFLRFDNPSEREGWEGYAHDTYFSGVVIRNFNFETVEIGSYFCG